MFDEPPEDQLGREPVRWIGHLAGAIGVLFFAAAAFFFVKVVMAPSVGGAFVTALVGAIAAFLLVVARRMTHDELARGRLMPKVFYKSLCILFGSATLIALSFAAVRPDVLSPLHTMPAVLGMGWFAWMCFLAGWRVDD